MKWELHFGLSMLSDTEKNILKKIKILKKKNQNFWEKSKFWKSFLDCFRVRSCCFAQFLLCFQGNVILVFWMLPSCRHPARHEREGGNLREIFDCEKHRIQSLTVRKIGLGFVDSSDPVSIFGQIFARHVSTSLPLMDVKSASRNKMHEENEQTFLTQFKSDLYKANESRQICFAFFSCICFASDIILLPPMQADAMSWMKCLSLSPPGRWILVVPGFP